MVYINNQIYYIYRVYNGRIIKRVILLLKKGSKSTIFLKLNILYSYNSAKKIYNKIKSNLDKLGYKQEAENYKAVGGI